LSDQEIVDLVRLTARFSDCMKKKFTAIVEL